MLFFIATQVRFLLAWGCRPIYCVLYGREEDTWICTRYILSCLCGLLLALLLWRYLIMANFGLSMEMNFMVLAALIVLITLSFVFSKSARCILLLILVASAGKSGRSYLRALSFAYVIVGPIENLSANGEEIARVFACATTLTYNLTKTRLDLMTKPFQRTLKNMKNDAGEVQRTFAEVKDIVEPIHREIEDDSIEPMRARRSTSQADNIQNKYKNKMKKRCVQQLESGREVCRKTFTDLEQRCLNTLPVIVRTLVCWFYKLDYVCSWNILGDPQEICDPSEAIPADMGANYVAMSDTEHQLVQNMSDFKVEYKVQKFERPPTLITAEETAKQVVKEVHRKRVIFDFIMEVMQTFLSLLFFRIIIESISYHSKYRKEIDFDNLYITDYFKHVDARRKKAGSASILPLKKHEKRKMIKAQQFCKRTSKENKTVILHLLQFSLEMTTGCFFLLLDYLIVELLDIIRSKSLITYTQSGEHVIHFQINGNGLMARLLRNTLRNFNMHERVSTFLSNEVCLPRPNALPRSFYIKLLCLYLAVIVLIFKSTLFIRLRRVICAYFYRTREKQRIIFLYNSILKQRKAVFEMLLKNIKTNAAKMELRHRVNLMLRLRLNCPQCFNWLKWFKSGRRKCLVCEELEDANYVKCDTPDCLFGYCRDCWTEIGGKCLICSNGIFIY